MWALAKFLVIYSKSPRSNNMNMIYGFCTRCFNRALFNSSILSTGRCIEKTKTHSNFTCWTSILVIIIIIKITTCNPPLICEDEDT